MFVEAPFISMLIFGFPFIVISIVFYFLCCGDASDQSEPDFPISDISTDDDDDQDQDQDQDDDQQQTSRQADQTSASNRSGEESKKDL